MIGQGGYRRAERVAVEFVGKRGKQADMLCAQQPARLFPDGFRSGHETVSDAAGLTCWQKPGI
jgi:hypothetical protein